MYNRYLPKELDTILMYRVNLIEKEHTQNFLIVYRVNFYIINYG